MFKCVIYARYSSENQKEESIEAQTTACEEFARSKGFTVVNYYIDKALTGTTDNRPAFRRLLDEASGKIFDIVLVHKFDRFSRDTLVHDLAKKRLNDNDVKLVSVLEPLDDSPESVITESLYKGMAEYYSRNLSREVRKGQKVMLNKIKETGRAFHMGGYLPYGYDLDIDKFYVINEQEAETIKRIYELFISGKGYLSIINDLTARGLKNKLKRPFSTDYIRNVLKYEQYTGVYIHKINPTNLMQRKNKKLLKDKMLITRVEGAMPQIISKEYFNKAREIMNVNQRTGKEKKAKEIYLLSGFIKCKKCGAVMIGNRTQINSYYICPNKKKSKSCDMFSVKKDDIEKIVFKYIEENFNKTVIDELTEFLEKSKSTFCAKYKEVEVSLKKELSKLQKNIDNLVNEIAEGRVSEIVRLNIELLDAKTKEINQKLDTIEIAKNGADVNKDDIYNYLVDVHNIKNLSDNKKRQIIKAIICEITLDAEIKTDSKKPTFTAEIHSILGKKWAEVWLPLLDTISANEFLALPIVKATYYLLNSTNY